MITDAMRKYLTDWHNWSHYGAFDGKPFFRRFGLCANAPSPDVKSELTRLFARQGLDPTTPFGTKAYFDDSSSGTQHLNQDRRNWVANTLLDDFLARYLAWAEAKAPDNTFTREVGLCSNAPYECQVALKLRLRRDFDLDNSDYPFGGFQQYLADTDKGVHHRNPERLAWIRKELSK